MHPVAEAGIQPLALAQAPFVFGRQPVPLSEACRWAGLMLVIRIARHLLVVIVEFVIIVTDRV